MIKKIKKREFNNLDPKGRKVMVDIETTGMDYLYNRIVEIALLETIDDVPTGREWYMKFNAGPAKFEDGARKILGYCETDIAHLPNLEDHMKEVVDFIGDATIVIHNSFFDHYFLQLAAREIGLNLTKNSIIDTIILARGFLRPTKASLDHVAEHFSIYNPRAKLKYHDALTDVRLLRDIYPFIVDHERRRQIKQITFKDIFEEPISDYDHCKIEVIPKKDLISYKKFLKNNFSYFWE